MKQMFRDKIALLGFAYLIILLLYRLFIKPSELFVDSLASLAVFIIFLFLFKKLNQTKLSLSLLLALLIFHNSGLYGAVILGASFDHYIHILGGFTLALIAFNFINEKMAFSKKALVIILVAMGLGAVGEVIEWVGYSVLGPRDGFLFYGLGDFGEWRNTIIDMIFNLLGAVIFCAIKWIKK